MGSHTFDAYNAMIDLVGPPPLMVKETIIALQHVMQRLDIIGSKIATVELIENLDKKIHNHIDTSILHHAFISICIALWAVITRYITILMPFLSYFIRFT